MAERSRRGRPRIAEADGREVGEPGAPRSQGVHASRAHEPSGWMVVVTHELRQVGLVTLYFLVCFGIILTLKKLFLADYRIEFYAFSATVIGALVAGKVVVLLSKTRVGTRFDTSHPLSVAVAYKTLLYSAAAFAVIFGESLFHAYRATGRLGEAVAFVWTHRDRDALLAKLMCVALAFVGYHFYAAIDERLGEGTLRRMVWSRRP